MQELRQAEDAYLELSEAKVRSRTVFSRSRALESTGTGTMLKRVEKLSAKIQALRQAEDAYLELSGAKGRSRTVFSRSCAWKSTGTGTMLSGRRSRVFASANRRARPLLRREDLSRTILAFNAQHSNSSRTVSPGEKIGKAVGEDASDPKSRRRQSGALRS
ncbi:unnamed protein product [Coccothraustes coccothraustes]